MRDLALRRYGDFERELGPMLMRLRGGDTVRRIREARRLRWPEGMAEEKQIDELAAQLTPDFGPWLALNPALEDVSRLSREVAVRLQEIGAVNDPVGALALKSSFVPWLLGQAAELLGASRRPLPVKSSRQC